MKNITAEYKYIYDPSHEHKPAGNWNRTGSGWSMNTMDAPAAPKHHAPAQRNEDEPKNTSVTAPKDEEQNDDMNLFDLDNEPGFDTEQTEEQEEMEPVVLEEKDENGDEPQEEQPQEEGEEKPSVDDGEGFTLKDDDGDQSEEPENNDELQDEPAEEENSEEPEGEEVPTEGEGGEEEPVDEGGGNEEMPDESEGDGSDEQPAGEGEEEAPIDDGDGEKSENDLPFGSDEKYLDKGEYDNYMEQMNSFVDKFDEGEGKNNQITFKAVAANLDWDNSDEIKAFGSYCEKQGMENAIDVLAFLYYQHKNNAGQFDSILDKMN